MAYGDTAYDATLKRAWEDFCDQLKAAGALVFQDRAPATPLERATGLQYLSRNISYALDVCLEHTDPLYPQLFRTMSPTRKWGGDNPDCVYLQACIDGEHTYRLVGNRGTVHYVAFSAQRRPAPGLGAEVGRILGDQLKTEWDGSFQIVLSPSEHPGNWIKTTPDTYRVNIRQFFGDWNREQPMSLRIERVGAEGPPSPLTPERVAEGLRRAGEFLATNSKFWADWQEPYRQQPNVFLQSRTAAALGAAPGGTPIHTYWKVQPEEVLLIEFTPPKCAYWNFELNTYWMTSVDYRYHLSSINGTQATLEDDGSARIAGARRDPGIPTGWTWPDIARGTSGFVGCKPIPTPCQRPAW